LCNRNIFIKEKNNPNLKKKFEKLNLLEILVLKKDSKKIKNLKLL
jgi:hypothetical protein